MAAGAGSGVIAMPAYPVALPSAIGVPTVGVPDGLHGAAPATPVIGVTPPAPLT